MIRKLLFTLTLLLVAAGENAVWADETVTVTEDNFWWFEENQATEYGDDQYDAVEKTLVIKTAGELAKFAAESSFNDGFNGWTITLGADIDLSKRTVSGMEIPMYWHPICATTEFKGTFNGDGHYIKGVKMDTRLIGTDGKSDPATLRCNAFGLFGIVSGTVENLKVEGCDIYVHKTKTSSSGQDVAALVGELKAGGTIRNCFVDGGTVEGKQYVGGIVGLTSGGTGDYGLLATIVGCKSSAKVTGESFVGGLVGQLKGNASLRYSLYTGESTVTASSGYAGLLVGDMSGATASGESETEMIYYKESSLDPVNVQNDRLYKKVSLSSSISEMVELDFGPSMNYSISGITAYENIMKYDDNYIAGANDKVIFGLNIIDNDYTYITDVVVNGKRAYKETADTYSFIMEKRDATVNAKVLKDNSWDQFCATWFPNIDENNKIITISTPEELGLLAYNVNKGNDYEGWTIELDLDDDDTEIDLGDHTWVPIGTPEHPFRGTFDGKGYTIKSLLIADTRWATDYTGLFGYVYRGTVKGVRLENCMIGGNNHVGGIAGALSAVDARVEDCYVDVSCVISGSGEYVGGVVGSAQSSTYVEGCVSAAPVQGVARVGGIIGQMDAYTRVRNNVFNGLDGEVTATATSNQRCAYIVGNINSNVHPYLEGNYTLTSTEINDYDVQGYSVTSGNSNITLTFGNEGEATATYATSGIKVYADHLRLGGVYYAPKGASIAIILGYTSVINPTFKNVTASSGTLTAVEDDNADNSKHTLVLNDKNQTNCVITANIGGVYWTDEGIRATSLPAADNNNTITITTAAQLGLLAYSVNNGFKYSGYTIKLGNDISLKSAQNDESLKPYWVPIGKVYKEFMGTFDGNGFTISGMAIEDDKTNYTTNDYKGLFGYVEGTSQTRSIIRNVKLTNSAIIGNGNVGGIVGFADSYTTIENCLVGTDVTVTGADGVGGIVGRLSGTGTVKGCVSGAKVEGKKDTEKKKIGGIIGETLSGATVQYNIYNGPSVAGSECVAAIIGNITDLNSTRTNNYFITKGLRGLNDYDDFAYAITSATNNMTVQLRQEDIDDDGQFTNLSFYTNGNGFIFNNQLYGVNGKPVSFNVIVTTSETPAGVWAIKANGDGTLVSYHGTGFNMTDNDGTGWFTMTIDDSACELTAVKASDNFEGKGEYLAPYLIHDKQEMLQLALLVNQGGEKYKDKYFRLENDLVYTADDNNNSKFLPVGTATHPFEGYFDGNGKTISGISYNNSNVQHIGIFGYIQYGEVSHLKLFGCTFTGNENSYVGGIAGYCHDTQSKATTILDCMVEASVTLSGKYVGGIAGWVGDENAEYAKANVEGCVSAATVTASFCAGGVIGWMRGKELQVKNCLYTGNNVTKPGEGGYRAYGVGNYNSNGITSADIYYTDQTLPQNINSADRLAYTVTPGTGTINGTTSTTDLIISHVAPTVSYSLTGIQGYTVGLTFNGKYYATKDQTVTFTLAAENGETVSNVEATPTTGDPIDLTPTNGKYTFTIVNSNYTINAIVTIDWAGEGTKDSPYIIDNIKKMNLLSKRSNDDSFVDKYFRLTADLDYANAREADYSADVWTTIKDDANNNFIPIRMFRGTFDGNGHSISGVKVSRTDNMAHAGIFAITSLKSDVRNLTVTNSTFTSEKGYAGGIVGTVNYSNTGGTEPFIVNCHVGNDVTVTSSASTYAAGGIVGNMEVGQLKGCTCGATVNQTGGGGFAGGIVGITNFLSVKIHENIYLGSSVTATNGNTADPTAVADAINARPTKAEQKYANFYTNSALSSIIGSKAYVYSTGTYTADAATTYSVDQKDAAGKTTSAGTITGIIRYDNNLLKYGDNFYSKYERGDANCNGYVNVTDYVGVIDYIHGRTTGLNTFTTDANGDGTVNVTDAVRVIEIIHGK